MLTSFFEGPIPGKISLKNSPLSGNSGHRKGRGQAGMMMIAFITFKSSLVPLFEGL